MKIFFLHYGYIPYIGKEAYIRSADMQYIETFFPEHAEDGYVSEIPFKVFGITSIDVVYSVATKSYYYTFLQ